MTFIRPEWLLLTPIALVVVWLWYGSRKQDGWQHLLPEHLAHKLLAGQKQSDHARWWHGVAVLLTLLLLITAMAGPSFSERAVQAQQASQLKVIVMSLNKSMAQTDAGPTRAQLAQFAIKDLLGQWQGSQVALVGYSGNASLVAPATTDYALIDNFLPLMSSEVPYFNGDNLVQGLAQAEQVFERAGVRTGQVIVVADHLPDDALAQAQRFQTNLDWIVDVIAVGTTVAERPVNLDNWQALATEFSGVARPRTALDTIAQRALIDQSQTLQESYVSRYDDGIWFAMAALIPLMLWVGQRQILAFAPIALLILAPVNADARLPVVPGESNEIPVQESPLPEQSKLPIWLQNNEQKALSYLHQGEYKKSLQLSQNPMIQGMAQYLNGDYQEAIEAWRQQPGIDSVFNQGVAYTQLQNLEAAKAAFEAILASQPDHQKAQENLQVLEEMLEQQQQAADQQEQQGAQQPDEDSESESSNADQTSPGSGQGNPQGTEESTDQTSDSQGSEGGEGDTEKDENESGAASTGEQQSETAPIPAVQGSGEDIDSARMMAVEPPDPALLLKYRFNRSVGEQ